MICHDRPPQNQRIEHLTLSLVYIGGGGQICPQAVFCYSSKTVGDRLLKLCGFNY